MRGAGHLRLGEAVEPAPVFHAEYAAARLAAGDERVHVDAQVLHGRVVCGDVHEAKHGGPDFFAALYAGVWIYALLLWRLVPPVLPAWLTRRRRRPA